ncbi:MAG: polysaccharide lyase beta-sandwich domain-containing protein [Marinilabiliales bacterium]|nr:polysaccharide lyase beta-sandwich domain-containing protein [Marinilabiliales bacterium]
MKYNKRLQYRSFLGTLLLLCGMMLLSTSLSAAAKNQPVKPGNALELLRKRVTEELFQGEVEVAKVKTLINTQRPDGTWPGINYADKSNTGFQHRVHLSNLVEMSLAFRKKGSPLKGNAPLEKAINLAIDHWLANDYICENWWWNQIGTPMALVSMELILDKSLTPARAEKLLPIIGRAYLNATGARPSGDRIKIAGILAKSLLFQRKEQAFESVIRVIEGEIKFATGRGMQYDYSFHHRVDNVNNTLSYGTGYADAFAEWAALTAGTPYQFSEHALHQLTDYYLDGICKMMVFGKYPDPGGMNRDITRMDANRIFSPATPQRLMTASDYRKEELHNIVASRQGENFQPATFAAFFWHSEYFTVQRPGWFTSVRMHSERDFNMEYPYNGEGLMNHHRGDGTNYLSRTGTEYFDLSPVYDWQKIPGATVIQKPALPNEKEVQKRGLSNFVGGATNGTEGVAAFDFKSPHDPLQAKKAWFFFDKAYVCLGAGITSDANYPVVTTLDQSALQGEVKVMTAAGESTAKEGVHDYTDARCVLHNGVAYLFPTPAHIGLSNETATGSWYKINHQSDSPKEEVSKKVFKLWVNHGVHPEDSTYCYLVMPGAKEADLSSASTMRILSNTTAIQAVTNDVEGSTGIVFYKAGKVEAGKNMTLSSEGPVLVWVQTKGDQWKEITVSDPSRKLSKVHLLLTGKIESKAVNYSSVYHPKEDCSELIIDLPQEVLSGKSVTIRF